MDDEPIEQNSDAVPVILRGSLVLVWLCLVVVLGLIPLTERVWALITHR